jgi:hypothetical protein
VRNALWSERWQPKFFGGNRSNLALVSPEPPQEGRWTKLIGIVSIGILLFTALGWLGWHFTSGGAKAVSTSSSIFGFTDSSQTTPSDDPQRCVITISDPQIQILSEPNYALQDGTNVPTGEYPIVTYKYVEWAGENTLWYEIRIPSGQQGWVPDDGVQIADESSACP